MLPGTWVLLGIPSVVIHRANSRGCCTLPLGGVVMPDFPGVGYLPVGAAACLRWLPNGGHNRQRLPLLNYRPQ
jgi:hypothetical protein